MIMYSLDMWFLHPVSVPRSDQPPVEKKLNIWQNGKTLTPVKKKDFYNLHLLRWKSAQSGLPRGNLEAM